MNSSDVEPLNLSVTERWLSLEEIAIHLGMSKVTLYKWIESGKIPGHKVGRNWKFKISEVDAWVLRGGGNLGESSESNK